MKFLLKMLFNTYITQVCIAKDYSKFKYIWVNINKSSLLYLFQYLSQQNSSLFFEKNFL